MTAGNEESVVVRSGRYFHLFVYDVGPGGLGPVSMPAECERVGTAVVQGTMYDLEDARPALVLAGPGSVAGEVWRCPVEVLADFDADERVRAGYLRRVGLQVEEYPCWVYVAGPKVAQQLVPGRRRR